MNKTVLQKERLKTLLETFKRQYSEKYHLRTLGYFGSYARDEATEDSDVDIVFETNAPNLFRTATMKQELESLLGRRVDVVRLRERMNPRLRDRIIREAFYV